MRFLDASLRHHSRKKVIGPRVAYAAFGIANEKSLPAFAGRDFSLVAVAGTGTSVGAKLFGKFILRF
jgi:hypothetical protein